MLFEWAEKTEFDELDIDKINGSVLYIRRRCV